MTAAWAGHRWAVLAMIALAPAALRAQSINVDLGLKDAPKPTVVPLAPTPAPPVPTPAATDTALPKPREIDPPGTYTNDFSGVPFPRRIGEYARTGVEIFDTESRNVGANYALRRSGNLVNSMTVFSYPVPAVLAGRGAAAAFEREKQFIVKYQPSARLVREEPYRTAGGAIGDFAEYEFNAPAGQGRTVPVRSRLYLFSDQGWLLKFRVTYAVSRERAGAQEAENFLRGFGAAPFRK